MGANYKLVIRGVHWPSSDHINLIWYSSHRPRHPPPSLDVREILKHTADDIALAHATITNDNGCSKWAGWARATIPSTSGERTLRCSRLCIGANRERRRSFLIRQFSDMDDGMPRSNLDFDH
jgi:hypothetical protein